MRILGVDPGTQRTGAGLVEIKGSQYLLLHSETLHLSPKLSAAEKLRFIYRTLRQVIKEFNPQVMALENIFFGKDLRAMIKIGEARACAMLAASEEGIPVVEYSPSEVKKALSGNGLATKEQVQFMVKSLLKMKTVPAPDSADALAIAICHAHSARGATAKVNETLGLSARQKRTWESVVKERMKN